MRIRPILKITVRDKNPTMAKTIADEIANVGAAFIAEKMDQDPPNVIQWGYTDGEAVSPSVLKNTAIGGVLGLLFASGIVVMAYLFNDTIMNAEDVEKKLGLNVLGTLPMEELEYDGESRKERKKSRRKNRKKA